MLLLCLREDVLLHLRPAFHAFDLTEQQARVLLILRETSALEQGVLAEMCCMHAPSLSRIIPRLRERGLIEQHKPTRDQRRTLVMLSQAGLQFEAGLRDALRDAYAEVSRRVGRDQLGTVEAELQATITALADPSEPDGTPEPPPQAARDDGPAQTSQPSESLLCTARERITRLEHLVAGMERRGHETILAPGYQLIQTFRESLKAIDALGDCLDVARRLRAAYP